MCLSAITTMDHDSIACRQNVIYWRAGLCHTPVYTLISSLFTNTSDVERLFVLMHLMPEHAKILATDHVAAVTDLECSHFNTICAAPTFTQQFYTPKAGGIVYRSLAAGEAEPAVPELRLDAVEARLAPGGCVQIILPTPLTKMKEFLHMALAAIPADATPHAIVKALHAINDALAKPDQLGATGFRPAHVPTEDKVLNAGEMDKYQSAIQDAMVSACGMLVVKMAAEKIFESCGDLAPAILREIFTDIPTDGTFNVSSHFNYPGHRLDATQLSAMRVRDTIAAHLDCNIVMFCTGMIPPGQSTRAVMQCQTEPGEDVPIPGQCHEDGNRTTETNIIVASPLRLDLTPVVAEGEDPHCGYMDKDEVWNARPATQPEAQGPAWRGLNAPSMYHSRILDEQREARKKIKAAMAQDKMEPGPIYAARRISGERPLKERVVSLKCTPL